MKTYHINSQGSPSVCTASERACPFDEHGELKGVIEAYKWASAIIEEQMEEEAKAMRALRKPRPTGRELLKRAEAGERVTYKELAEAYPYASVESVEWLERQWKKPQTFGNLTFRAALDAFEVGSWRSLGRD